jgi:hypothetical protein
MSMLLAAARSRVFGLISVLLGRPARPSGPVAYAVVRVRS